MLSQVLGPRVNFTTGGQGWLAAFFLAQEKLGDKSNASSEVEYRNAWGVLLGPLGRGAPGLHREGRRGAYVGFLLVIFFLWGGGGAGKRGDPFLVGFKGKAGKTNEVFFLRGGNLTILKI